MRTAGSFADQLMAEAYDGFGDRWDGIYSWMRSSENRER